LSFRADVWISRNQHTGKITLEPMPDTDALQVLLAELRSAPVREAIVRPGWAHVH
jgi:hypothetical protein